MEHIRRYNFAEHSPADIGRLFNGFGATPEVTNTISVNELSLSKMRSNRSLGNFVLHDKATIFVPSDPQIYVQNGGDYRIAIDATNVVYGPMAAADAMNRMFGYKNFRNIVSVVAEQRPVNDGYFMLFLNANPRLQRKAR